MPGGRVLAGCPTAHSGGESLGPQVANAAQTLIGHLIIDSLLDHFGRGQALEEVKNAVVASLIMYHPRMVQKYGTHNILNNKMLDAAEKSKIKDPSMRGADYLTSQVLDFWSQKIQEDFECHNTSRPIASNPDSLYQVANIQSQQINTLVRTVASMKQKM
jgi:hypothetical protein